MDLFSQEKEVAYFRKSEKLTCDPISIFSWKYYAFYESSKLDCPVKFKKEDLQSLVNELNQLFEANQNTIELTKEILGRYGIKFIVLPKFDKTPVDGFSFWQGDNPTIVLTLRLNRIDNYAFSLMHEIWHVYAHLINNKEDRFIAIEGAKLDKCEDEANKFAKNALINKEIWANFLNQYSRISPHAMQEKIKSFARLHHINEAIVLGFYQHDINLYSIVFLVVCVTLKPNSRLFRRLVYDSPLFLSLFCLSDCYHHRWTAFRHRNCRYGPRIACQCHHQIPEKPLKRRGCGYTFIKTRRVPSLSETVRLQPFIR